MMKKQEPTLIWTRDADLIGTVWVAPSGIGGFYRVRPDKGGWTIETSDAALLPAKIPGPFKTAMDARLACQAIHNGATPKAGAK